MVAACGRRGSRGADQKEPGDLVGCGWDEKYLILRSELLQMSGLSPAPAANPRPPYEKAARRPDGPTTFALDQVAIDQPQRMAIAPAIERARERSRWPSLPDSMTH